MPLSLGKDSDILSNIHYLDYEDCLLKSYSEAAVRQEVVGAIRKIQPNIVISWDPTPYLNLIPSTWGDLGYHPDHQISGKFAMDGVWSAGLGRLWPSLGEGWSVSQFYMWAFNPALQGRPMYYVDITGEPFQAKTDAFLAMKSQHSDPEPVKALLQFTGESAAQLAGLEEDRLAEGLVYILW